MTGHTVNAFYEYEKNIAWLNDLNFFSVFSQQEISWYFKIN